MNNEQHINKLIKGALQDNSGLNNGFNEARIINAWNKVVGEYVAGQADKLFVRDRILYVDLPNNALRYNLHYQRSKICKAINDLLKESLIKEVILR